MVRDPTLWAEWEASYIASQPADLRHNLELLEAMYAHARYLGVFPLADPLEGLAADIRMAKALNVPTPSRSYRTES